MSQISTQIAFPISKSKNLVKIVLTYTQISYFHSPNFWICYYQLKSGIFIDKYFIFGLWTIKNAYLDHVTTNTTTKSRKNFFFSV